MDPIDPGFASWEKITPRELVGDPIWRLPAYRLSRYLALRVEDDANAVRCDNAYVADQLQRAVDSIRVNISEGYGRLHGRERARFYEFALGSAREARDWYIRSERYLKEIAHSRAMLLARVIKILTVAIPQERAGSSERRMRDAIARTKPKSPEDEEKKEDC